MALNQAELAAVMAIKPSPQKGSLTPAELKRIKEILKEDSETNFSNFNPQKNMAMFGNALRSIPSGIDKIPTNLAATYARNKGQPEVEKRIYDSYEKRRRKLEGSSYGQEGSGAGEAIGSILPSLASPLEKSLLGLMSSGALIGFENSTPDSGFGKSTLEGVALSAIPSSFINGTKLSYAQSKKLLVSLLKRMGSGTATPAEIRKSLALMKNRPVLGGGAVPVTGGEVLNSPLVKRMQSTTSANIPWSSIPATFDTINQKMQENAQKIFDHLKGGKDLDYTMTNAIRKIKGDLKEQRAQADILNSNLDDELEKSGTYMSFKNLKKLAKEELRKYDEATKMHGPVLGNADINSVLDNYSNLPDSMKVTKENKSLYSDKLKEINALMKKKAAPVTKIIGDESLPRLLDRGETTSAIPEKVKYSKIAKNELYKRGDDELSPYRKGIYKSLSSALDDDIKASVAKNPEAKKLLKKADDNYKKNLAKYYDKQVVGFSIGDDEPSKVFKSFIKKGENESPEKLEKFVSLLDSSTKKEIGALVLKNAQETNGKINPYKMSDIYKKIGNRTREMLFSPKENASLKLLADRSNLTEGARDFMTNQQNGKVNIFMNTLHSVVGSPLKSLISYPVNKALNSSKNLESIAANKSLPKGTKASLPKITENQVILSKLLTSILEQGND